jgi:hypothetical protein
VLLHGLQRRRRRRQQRRRRRILVGPQGVPAGDDDRRGAVHDLPGTAPAAAEHLRRLPLLLKLYHRRLNCKAVCVVGLLLSSDLALVIHASVGPLL